MLKIDAIAYAGVEKFVEQILLTQGDVKKIANIMIDAVNTFGNIGIEKWKMMGGE
jgi:hypothetical protein